MEEREHVVGKSVTRVECFGKSDRTAKYTEDLCDKSAYIARVLHADIAHGIVRSVDTSEAQKLSGVVKIVTCFDVPEILFPDRGTSVVYGSCTSGCQRPPAFNGACAVLRG